MQLRSRNLVLLLVLGMFASVGTISAARMCLEDEFGAEYNLDVNGTLLSGHISFQEQSIGVVMGTRARLDGGTVIGLTAPANCPTFGPLSMTIFMDRSGGGLATALSSDCEGDTTSFCDEIFEAGGELLCDEPAIEFRRCSDAAPRETAGRHPLLTP